MQFLCYILLILGVVTAKATEQPLSKKPLVKGKTLSIASQYIEQTPSFDLYLPSDYHITTSQRTYPLIVTLDGWLLSETTHGVVNHLGNTASMPKAIVVSIHSHDRFAWGPELYISQSGWQGDKTERIAGFAKGHSQSMINYLQKELLPFLKSQYRVNDFRIFVGASPTAAFGLHTLAAAPDLFNAHFLFAATDVIGQGYTPDTSMIDAIVKSLAKNPHRKGYLYVASAKREAEENPVRYTLSKKLQEALAPYSKTFKVRVEHIDNFGHYPMIIPGLLSAIDLVFPRKDWDIGKKFIELEQQGDNTLKRILEYYELLSRQVGFTVYPNLNLTSNAACIRSSAQRLRGQGRYKDADELFNYWIAQSPNSASAVAGLGVSKARQENTEEAVSLYRDALKITKPDNLRMRTWLESQIKTLSKQ
ncbi:alpha/beta hydrolase-fold protein [Pseudoalteromonas luteoviolacea]|uniref:alpha/beta hydrolase-fold protein n=1 Tax=Pseudoalteromonas luteoviolacea TaxID=43657 RepID=UPI001B3764AC|nr:alpha/beta hydrolase-fold protein [Pseudoalteromonas luteoviolacea]MBQ4834833.1 hypothetical protein [Pseudoalteromonas luteoviolacea]